MNAGRERRPTRRHRLALGVALAWAAACLGACGRAGAEEADLILPDVHFEQLFHDVPRPATLPAGERYDTISRRPDDSPSMSWSDDHDNEGRDRVRRRGDGGRGHGRVAWNASPVSILLIMVGVVAVFALLGVRRRRLAAESAGFNAPAVKVSRGAGGAGGADRAIVALACNRCSRVIDVPRHRLAHGLFCPRCGSRMAGSGR